MFNKTARVIFEEQLEKARNLDPGDLVASESELCYAAGFISYALLCGDIDHTESTLLHHRISAVRSNRVARLCRDDRMARA
ncbi:hypothetical protein FBY06_11570 [Pseudomonas sp. SJZ085]|nr:hypothetical protein FBX99_11570 [Pseudomonas sp. SJZ074]TWC36117.1 hypothetical protein FBY06_11570 [Pseudomonas sp. SJZ085]